MTINQLKALCDELTSISSTLEKRSWLLTNQSPDLDILLKFLCDDSIITGIDKKKLNSRLSVSTDVFAPYTLSELFDYLKANNTGSHYDIMVAKTVINNYSRGDKGLAEWLGKVITKTLKLGVNTKTLNTVYGKGYIPVHEVQLGSPRDKLRLKKDEVFWLTQKLNGVRATYVDGQLISRQGKPFSGLGHIITDLQVLGENLVFDGELIRYNIDNVSDNENFRIGTGILNSDEGDKTCLQFNIFDVVTLEQFKNQTITDLYEQRREKLDGFTDTDNIKFVKVLYQGKDAGMIDACLAIADNMGWEGLMLNKNAPYEFKRTTNLIKIKTFHFSDLKVVGYTEGDGKYVGTLGALIVEYKGNTVNVGSGYTDEQRDELWSIKNGLIGTIIEVKYKEESTDKDTGLKSLQFPVFSRLRDDKDEESIE